MVWMLTEEEVAKHWDLIKWGACQVNKPLEPEKYFLGLLKEIYLSKAQVWFLADKDKTLQIKGMAITRIVVNVAGLKELVIDAVYAYSPMLPQEHLEAYGQIMKFAKYLKVSSIITYTTQPIVAEMAKRLRMEKVYDCYRQKVEVE